MNDHLPPSWADALLRFVIRPADSECIAGDLLEEYRDAIVPQRGHGFADLWYVVQVLGYVWHATRWGALVFSGVFLARTAYDWLVPTTDFITRSTVTTIVAASTLSIVGFRAAWRAESVATGVAVTVLTSQVAAILSTIGVTAMLILWHDDATIRAIQGSGGLPEQLTLPFTMIIPAAVLGASGGICGRLSRRMLSAMRC